MDTADDGRRAVSFVKARGVDFIFHREGVRFLIGTDLAAATPYPGSSVHEELAWPVKAGLTPMEALIAGTRNGAEAVWPLRRTGNNRERQVRRSRAPRRQPACRHHEHAEDRRSRGERASVQA